MNQLVHMKKEILHDASEFSALRGEWNRLASRFRHPMLTHQWHEAAIAALSRNDRLHVLLMRGKSGDIESIAPLVRLARLPRQFSLLGNHCVPEPSFLLYSSVHALRETMRVLVDHGVPLRFARIPKELFPEEERILPSRVLEVKRAEGGSPWLPVKGSFDEFEASLSSQRRADLRRAMRRARAKGAVRFEVLTPEPGDEEKLLARFYLVEQQSWKRASRTATYLDPALTRFFSMLALRFSESKALRFGFMYVGDAPVAAQIVLRYGGALWILKIAHDESFQDCSPGLLLMHEMIRYAFDSGLEAFEFLGFEERWITPWTRVSREYFSHRVYGISLLGTATLASDAWTSLRRKITQRSTRAHGTEIEIAHSIGNEVDGAPRRGAVRGGSGA